MSRRNETGCGVALFALLFSGRIFVALGFGAEFAFSSLTDQPLSRGRTFAFAIGLFTIGTFIRILRSP